jgi:hypothetical protein
LAFIICCIDAAVSSAPSVIESSKGKEEVVVSGEASEVEFEERVRVAASRPKLSFRMMAV